MEAGIGVVLSQFLIQVVFPILGAIILVLIGWAIKKAARKWDLDFLVAYRDQIGTLAMQAVNYAEEWAAGKAKEATRITGRHKMDAALMWMMKRVPEIEKDEAKEWIESALRQMGAGASGKNADSA